jgi:hypothetical protein
MSLHKFVMINLPSKSVTTSRSEPATISVAPSSSDPSWRSVIIPVSVKSQFCEKEGKLLISRTAKT